MVFKATFNNMSAISWRAVLLVEETRVPRENQCFQECRLVQINLNEKKKFYPH